MMSYENVYGGQPNMGHGMYPGMQQGEPIVCPPEYFVRDEFMPREVPVIHPIVNVNRQHTVDVPRHYYTQTTENVMGAPMMARPGYGPGYGPGCGSRCGRRCRRGNRFGWR